MFVDDGCVISTTFLYHNDLLKLPENNSLGLSLLLIESNKKSHKTNTNVNA